MLAWFLGAGWAFFVPLIPDSIEAEQAEIQFKERMKDCDGSFKERYDCKSALKSQRDAEKFVPLMTAIGVVFIPILILFIGMNKWAKGHESKRQAELRETTVEKRQEIREEEEKRREENRKIQQEQIREQNIEAKRRSEISRADENARAENKPDPIHVLLVLKDEDEGASLSKELSTMGCHVIYSNTLEDGLIGIKKLRYDIVVLGILIEGMGGIEGIKTVREYRNDIKIIATSAGVEEVDAEDVLKAAQAVGADETLARPYEAKDLGKMIHRIAPDKSAPE